MDKWNDFQNGLCTDEEYVKSEYSDFIGKVVSDNHNYYVFKELIHNNHYYYIRDFENGLRSAMYNKDNLTFNEVFEFLYQEDNDFKTYVDNN